jgi:phosphohistidine phosphatase SixA
MIKFLFVRHADVDTQPPSASSDPPGPPLNAAGRSRAETLAHVVGAAGITHIFTSEFLRTQQTVDPVARKLGITHRVAPEAQVRAMRSAVDGSVILIAGHSNTVPQMITSLGVLPALENLGAHEFDNLFVVTIASATGPAALVRLKYGEPSA